MLNDFAFLKDSKLKNYYQFYENPDPFLLSILEVNEIQTIRAWYVFSLIIQNIFNFSEIVMLQEDLNFKSEQKTDRQSNGTCPKNLINKSNAKKVKNAGNIKFPSSLQNEPLIKIRPIELCEYELFNYLSNYSFKIPEYLSSLFIIESSELLKIREDYALEINVLEIHISKLEGLALTFVERNTNNYRKMNIVHFTTISSNFYSNSLETLIKYISEKDYCDEIRLWLKNNTNKKCEFDRIEKIFKKIGFDIVNIGPEFTTYKILIGKESKDDHTKKKS